MRELVDKEYNIEYSIIMRLEEVLASILATSNSSANSMIKDNSLDEE